MEDRTLIIDCVAKVGQEVVLDGWVQTVRSHGKIAFLDLRDRTGVMQVVATDEALVKTISTFGVQDVIQVKGFVKNREERYVNKASPTGIIEFEAKSVAMVQKAAEMPFDMGGKDLKLELPTLLDYRTLTLRHPKIQAIFKVQERIVEEFRNAAKNLGCMEVFPPTIAPTASEGGADVFAIDYYGHKAYLAQSPQLYKQMLLGPFERVFMISHAYRAEPSVTTRHLSELVQIDIELGFATFPDLLDALESVGTTMLSQSAEKSPEELAMYGATKPLIGKIPRLKLREAQEILAKRLGKDLSKEQDLNPEDEKEICAWAKEEYNTDFVTITHFPTMKKPFYTKPDPKDPEYSLSYDLLFRGIEISSGSQRINDYNELIAMMEKRGLDTKKFGMYLQAFTYGIPPEGGFSFGIERLTMKLLNLPNVREASLFPRDMERVDERLSVLFPKERKTK